VVTDEQLLAREYTLMQLYLMYAKHVLGIVILKEMKRENFPSENYWNCMNGISYYILYGQQFV